ncbi:hypothetical protein BEWA_047600 [Theileria equi strain WA]|uniref:Uncharacterized protein n=1 Tax=Theileria equi strain WA TaxID=1537102 RepID=L1LAJ7_THEEQ|nr:hypothetical protein BEWA_047600 [Theileria equi strain WA]EKX72295.1 hypothetical protein BEWA_047600 [Theileria equi strain WA]|eukprot:XP_004831747.1 hypothetical protein BEWA_047600 [Theileria equi strain WA]
MTNSGVDLDIDPKKKDNPGSGIKGDVKDDHPQGYKRYEYKKSSKPLEITGFKYDKHKLLNLISISGIQITKVVTYFDKKGNKLLVIHVEASKEHYYYTNISDGPVNGETKFDSFVTVGKNALNENSEIKTILKMVENGERPKPEEVPNLKSKLRDLSENLIINLNEAEKSSVSFGKYNAGEKKEIHFDKKISTDFSYIIHCYGLTDFTVTSIKTKTGDIPSGIIPTKRIRKLKVFYNGDPKDSEPLLIYFLESSGTNKWICQYYGDTDWENVNSRDGIPANDNDDKKIKNLLENIAIPNVDLDLSKSGSTYKPSKNNLYFKVSKTQNPPKSGIFQFKHTEQKNKVFKITKLDYDHDLLTGIKCDKDLVSVSAYYLGDTPKPDQLMMVELVCGDGNYIYFKRNNSPYIWTKIPDQENKLENQQLDDKIKELNKEYLDASKTEDDDSGSTQNFHNYESGGTEDPETSIYSATPSSQSSSSSGVSGAVIGGIVGGILGLAVFAFLAWKGVARMRSRV